MTKQKLSLILITIIVVVASLLRVWQLDSQMIFFGDAAHDLLAARQALIEKNLPLLGIESSVPRFRQGPVSVWIIMASQVLFGITNTYGIAVVFALMSIGAVIATYELMTVAIDKKVGIIAAALLAVFPMAVAHGRVPYHITPIPLVTILFLWAQWRLWQKKKFALPMAFLSWAVLFQFELALLPLIAVPVYIVWRQKKRPSNKSLGQSLLALLVGLSPQILFDLTHKFQHLGGFSLWVGYRIAAFGGYKDAHTFSLERLMNTSEIFWFYFRRIVSYDQHWLAGLFLLLFVISLYYIWHQYKKNKLHSLLEITTVSFVLLVIAYVIHGSPSEAYFPPFAVLIAIITANFLGHLLKNFKPFVYIGISLYMALNSWQIYHHNFFVSNNHPYSYGPSIQEQRNIMRYITQQTNHNFSLRTTNPAGKFASYFDNLKWVYLEQDIQNQNNQEHVFYVETDSNALDNYPSIKKVTFDTISVYQLL